MSEEMLVSKGPSTYRLRCPVTGQMNIAQNQMIPFRISADLYSC